VPTAAELAGTHIELEHAEAHWSVGGCVHLSSLIGVGYEKTIVPARASPQARSRPGNAEQSRAVKSITYEGTHCPHPGALIERAGHEKRQPRKAPHNGTCDPN